MVKMVSLSDEAYFALASLKNAGESFSKVILKLYGSSGKKSANIMSFAGIWSDNPEMDSIFEKVLENRGKRRGVWERAGRH